MGATWDWSGILTSCPSAAQVPHLEQGHLLPGEGQRGENTVNRHRVITITQEETCLQRRGSSPRYLPTSTCLSVPSPGAPVHTLLAHTASQSGWHVSLLKSACARPLLGWAAPHFVLRAQVQVWTNCLPNTSAGLQVALPAGPREHPFLMGFSDKPVPCRFASFKSKPKW